MISPGRKPTSYERRQSRSPPASGPTASGKSDVAMAAALTVPGTEVVAVDAMQVYRGMDIGTAKPTASDRAAVPHHGLDLVEPAAPFGVTDFVAAFDEAIDTIAERGGRPRAHHEPSPAHVHRRTLPASSCRRFGKKRPADHAQGSPRRYIRTRCPNRAQPCERNPP